MSSPADSALASCRHWFREHLADRIFFPLWLLFQCLRHRRRAVILFRLGVLGDLICTLPLCAEIRKRHPRRLLLLVTMRDYRPMARLAEGPDGVYGAHSWAFSEPGRFGGLVEKIFAPRTTDEISPNAGPTCHLIDDLARSCDIAVTDRQPRLHPSPALIDRTLSLNGLPVHRESPKKLIAISWGRTWAVREWSFDRWQELVDLIHTKYDATVILFGLGDSQNEQTKLRGVRSFTNHRIGARDLATLIAACDLVISIDSGPVHVAGAVGTPVVGLFGAVNPQFRLPPASPAAAVTADVPCLFCHHRTPRGHWQTGCPHDIRCMRELSVARVFAAVTEMLDRGQ